MVRRWTFQDLGLAQPHMRVRWNLDHGRFTARVETIQKRPVMTVQFVRRPRHHADAIGLRSVDQIQRDLRLGLDFDLVREATFFRRTASSAHSRGRDNRASHRQLYPGAEYAKATLLIQ